MAEARKYSKDGSKKDVELALRGKHPSRYDVVAEGTNEEIAEYMRGPSKGVTPIFDPDPSEKIKEIQQNRHLVTRQLLVLELLEARELGNEIKINAAFNKLEDFDSAPGEYKVQVTKAT